MCEFGSRAMPAASKTRPIGVRVAALVVLLDGHVASYLSERQVRSIKKLPMTRPPAILDGLRAHA